MRKVLVFVAVVLAGIGALFVIGNVHALFGEDDRWGFGRVFVMLGILTFFAGLLMLLAATGVSRVRIAVAAGVLMLLGLWAVLVNLPTVLAGEGMQINETFVLFGVIAILGGAVAAATALLTARRAARP